MVILRVPRRALTTTFVAVAMTAAGLGSVAVSAVSSDYTVALWPASGCALAAALWFGRSIWPGVWIAGFLTMAAASGHVVWALFASAGIVVESIVVATLVERFARGVQVYRRPDTILRLTAIVAIFGAPITATTASLAAVVAGPIELRALGLVWTNWWLASVAGTAVVAPIAMLWTSERPPSRIWPLVEALLMLAVLALVALAVFAGRFPADAKNYPLEFLCVPFLLWVAFRQGPRTVAVAAAILCAIAAWGTTNGFGPFVRDGATESRVLVQCYSIVTATMAAVIAAVIAAHREAQAQLREMASTDPLTGLANYRRLLEVLRQEIIRSNRTGRTFVVLFLDMDGLKSINDRQGHLAGSRALCRLADTLKTTSRAMDTCARFGGDEFAIVLPETLEVEGHAVLDRISARLATLPELPPISVSGGVAVFPRDGSSPTQLLRSADKVLYEAKSRGAARRHFSTEELRTGTNR